jgi:hypothetical protein
LICSLAAAYKAPYVVADLQAGAFELFLVVDSPFDFNSFVAAALSRHLSYFLPPTTQRTRKSTERKVG